MNTYTVGMKSVVSERGQVTIPKAIRDRLGIRPGTELDFEAERGRLVARKVNAQDPVDAVYGILQTERSTDEIIEELRGKPDAV
jgi:AbrB family looped-hinge helix DNA binding protein